MPLSHPDAIAGIQELARHIIQGDLLMRNAKRGDLDAVRNNLRGVLETYGARHENGELAVAVLSVIDPDDDSGWKKRAGR